MSYKKVGTTLSRALWNNGSRTPPLARSSKVSAFSTRCELPGGQTSGEKTFRNDQGCGSNSCTAVAAVPSSSTTATPAAHRHQVVGKKRYEESLAVSGRSYSSTALKLDNKTYLWARYNEMKRLVHGKWEKEKDVEFILNIEVIFLMVRSSVRHTHSPAMRKHLFRNSVPTTGLTEKKEKKHLFIGTIEPISLLSRAAGMNTLTNYID